MDATPTDEPLVVWRLLDGKAGHENQVLGLAEALERCTLCHHIDVDASRALKGFRAWLPGRTKFLDEVPAPHLLLGAGHSTHLPLLSLKRQFGGRTVMLMKPTLPMGWFDVCYIPSFHNLRPRPNLMLTEGTLNRIQPSNELQDHRGLVLLGGPSSHFRWSDQTVLDQLAAVCLREPGTQWTITTSRRTPASFVHSWRMSGLPGDLFPFHQTSGVWLADQMRISGRVWVTCESISMIFQSLTAGAAVGLLELPVRKESRITQCIRQLDTSGFVTLCTRWQSDRILRRTGRRLAEADRCAADILRRFPLITPR
ncbi:MAG: mitochondrial fission ELM1 family protein [Planctomycetaceae bacterium]|nr:mitochondrial fission ELM1 family protein [Planctomycetaceae bacterium]